MSFNSLIFDWILESATKFLSSFFLLATRSFHAALMMVRALSRRLTSSAKFDCNLMSAPVSAEFFLRVTSALFKMAATLTEPPTLVLSSVICLRSVTLTALKFCLSRLSLELRLTLPAASSLTPSATMISDELVSTAMLTAAPMSNDAAFLTVSFISSGNSLLMSLDKALKVLESVTTDSGLSAERSFSSMEF